MTNNEERAKEWLNRNYGESIYINSLRRRLERLESEINKMTKPLARHESQICHDDNSQENKLTEYLDFLEELRNKEIALFNHDLETVNVIDKVESFIFRTILTERYVNRLKWSAISELTNTEQRTLYRYHAQALDAVSPFIPGGDSK